MKTIKNDILSMDYQILKHKSGLTMCLMPLKDYSSVYAIFGTDYGSVDTAFKLKGEENILEVPEGIAHFLEHKLFENEECDAFERYAKTGASANAYTSFDKTCYLFKCADKFPESLEILLDFVTHPYFTEQTVKKEQGIIGQEIKMYEDSPEWRVFFNTLGAMYHKNPVKIDIAGTTESIAQIDKDLLYRCYNTFYNLNNMVLCVVGNFSTEDVLTVADKVLTEAPDCEIIRGTADEPDEIVEKEVVQKLPVALPLFNIGFKETPPKKDDVLKNKIICELLEELICGETSELYKEMYNSALINSTFSYESFSSKDSFAAFFSGESKEPRKVKEKLIEKINEMKKNGIDENRFLTAKKLMLGRYIRSFNSVENIGNSMVSLYFEGKSVFSPVDVLYGITIEDLEEYMKKGFDENRSVISIVEK